MEGDERVRGEERVDLEREHGGVVGRRREPVHDREQRVGVLLELRPLLLVGAVLERERVEPEPLADEGDVLGGGGEVDPERPAGAGELRGRRRSPCPPSIRSTRIPSPAPRVTETTAPRGGIG